ncbi:MAG TPA: AMP-binding protein [Ignavibacteriaceae bacterium]|nr:AMP-binding protein [Ignavibacteriaceae bacterium]
MKNYKLYKVPQISSVQDMLIKTVNKYGDKLAVEDIAVNPISKASYKELLDYTLKFGNALKNLGLKERSHIAVIGENRLQWGIAYLTAMAFNYVVVPIDKNLNANEILNILYESDSEAIVFTNDFENLLSEQKGIFKKLKFFISMDHLAHKGEFLSMKELIDSYPPENINNLPKINPDEMAEIIFTSGSLGRAKGVMLSQKNISSNLMDMVSALFIYPQDKFLSVLPMHHTYECTCGFLCPLYCGASVSFARSLKTITDDIQRVKATVLLGVPLLFDKMFKRIYKSINEDKVKSKIIKPLIRITDITTKVGWNSSKKIVFSELHNKFGGAVRLFIAGGAAPDPKTALGLREFGFTFLQGYGLTETSPILALNKLNLFKDNAAGIPLPNVDIKINNPDADGVGEIYAKGKNVMLGYYRNEALTKEAFDDGWFKTGDLGCFDEEGFLHISGRKKNVIIANNGKNVFPEEIEDILNRSPFIQECMVYGEKDSKHDEIIAAQIFTDTEAFIEYSEKNSVNISQELVHKLISDEVKKVNAELSSFKQIKKFYIREKEFEKTTTQKVKRYLVHNNQIESQD